MKKWGYPGKAHEYEEKLLKKIRETIKNYERQWFQADWQRVKNLEWPFFEFCISAGWTNYLIRIFFFHSDIASIILTWNLIKPENYKDKQNTDYVDREYQQELKFCKRTQKDFLWEKKLDYQLLEL